MAIALDPYEIETDVPTCLPTTLYDLMAALQDVVAPHEDALVVGLIARWLRTGRITSLGDAAARLCALQVGLPLALDHRGTSLLRQLQA